MTPKEPRSKPRSVIEVCLFYCGDCLQGGPPGLTPACTTSPQSPPKLPSACWKPPDVATCIISVSSGTADTCPRSLSTPLPCSDPSALHAQMVSTLPQPHPVSPSPSRTRVRLLPSGLASAPGRAAALVHSLADFYTSPTSPGTLKCRAWTPTLCGRNPRSSPACCCPMRLTVGRVPAPALPPMSV